MIKNKYARVAFGSLLGRAIKLVAAPVTLLVISKQLSSEELGFYFTFFSLVSMQQLAELGIGHVMRQHISHAYLVDNNKWNRKSKEEIKAYFYFSLLWFLCVALFMLTIVGSAGWWYLSLSDSSVDWNSAWWLLILVSSLATLVSPFTFILDGTQRQELLIKANLISSLLGSLSLWASLSLGLGLHSIAVSSIVTSVSLFITIWPTIMSYFKVFNSLDSKVNIKDTFFRVWGLLKKVSIVWAFGFLFWNAFNLISFQIYDPDYAGKIIFAVALARMGFGVAESITQGQMTIFSNLISSGDISSARDNFKKYSKISIFILVSGYTMFIGIWQAFPEIYIFDKLPSKEITIQVFVFFLVLIFLTLRNNFVRCFKIEPFVKQSIVMNSLLPIVYYLSATYTSYSFLLCALFLICVLIYANRIHKEYFK
ncbi:hypothetical protein [Vibrio parahaemolyticus]|uniref:hypothetical protein n=1 Tax=Vibrio parahaemolyticus TaxID=670 RepID=UPI001F4F086F|nr:hypothetical protein [Vibrio parahaemolyticus]